MFSHQIFKQQQDITMAVEEEAVVVVVVVVVDTEVIINMLESLIMELGNLVKMNKL